jgi:hypothetical protein
MRNVPLKWRERKRENSVNKKRSYGEHTLCLDGRAKFSGYERRLGRWEAASQPMGGLDAWGG